MGARLKIMDTDSLSLAEYKAEKFRDIDDRTAELIVEGYTHSSKKFSMSLNAQINLSALHQSRAALSYPIVYNTKDDLDSYSVADEATLTTMYNAALGFKKGILDEGTVLKNSVRSAADKSAVDAVIDNR